MVILNIQKPMCTKETVNCREKWLYQKVTSQLVETVTHVFTDIPFLDSHSVILLQCYLVCYLYYLYLKIVLINMLDRKH